MALLEIIVIFLRLKDRMTERVQSSCELGFKSNGLFTFLYFRSVVKVQSKDEFSILKK